MKRIKMIAIVVCILVILSFLSFTYISAIKEPKRPVPKIFSYITRNHPSPSPPFSKSFSLYGINGTFQFRAYVAYRTFFKPYCGYPITTVWVNVTETNQKTPFGLGSMSILVDKVNLTESYGAHLLFITDQNIPQVPYQSSPVEPYTSISNTSNQSSFSSFFQGIALGNYTLRAPYNSSIDYTFISEYNISISIDVTPYVELGPYYALGTPVWISYTYEFR